MVYAGQPFYSFRAALAEALRPGRRTRIVTAEALRRHAEQHGPDLVNETARQVGVEVRVDAVQPKRRRRSTRNLRGQVLELHARGAIPAAIADTLDVSDRRVREILTDAG